MLKKILKFMSLILMAGLVVLVSCNDKDDDPETPPVVILDGIYVQGAATALTALDAKGLMQNTNNEVGQAERPSLYELYIAVKAGAEGFNIVQVSGSIQTVYGPGADFADVVDVDLEEPQVTFQRGSYTEAAGVFTVPADGLYHVTLDTEFETIAVVPVEYWGLIGGATAEGWSGDTKLMPEGFDLNTMTFSATDVVLTKGDFKYRYDGGWKVEIDTTGATEDDYVKVNTNFGGAVNALVPGGDNITNDVLGYYTATMVWTLGSGYSAEMTKTGDLEVFDYTATELGLVGDGIMVGGVQHNWDETIMLHVPTVENETDYTWTYAAVEITTAGSFKIREGQDWTAKSIGFNDVTMAGLAADKFEANGDGNFVPLEDGTFDLELFIDAITEEYTLTVNPAGVATELYMLGDGTNAGWEIGAPIPLDGTGGLYTITTDLPGGGGIKFVTTIGEWQPQYGTDATGTSTGGPLFVNDGTGSDPDPVPGPAAGTYLITVNTNDMTYTIGETK